MERRETPSVHQLGALIDGVINEIKWPLYWVHEDCSAGQSVPNRYDGDMYSAARELWALGEQYLSFETAFTYATLGIVSLRLEGNQIVIDQHTRSDTQYESYDRFISADRTNMPETPAAGSTLLNKIMASVQVKGENFRYLLNPSIVAEGLRTYETLFEHRFQLADDFEFTRYSIGAFHQVAKVLWVLAIFHLQARTAAAMKGCIGGGYASSLCVMGRAELRARLARYSGLDGPTIDAIVTDMTYGERGIRNPDPALQPFVPLTSERIAFSPTMILYGSLERNHMVLMNRIPEERDMYSRFSKVRETMTRAKLEQAADQEGHRTWHGEIPSWDGEAEIDLVLISDVERTLLICELKSFIAPAETREIKHKSEEISDGIAQIERRRMRYRRDPAPLLAALHLDGEWSAAFVVVSETSIGPSYVQNDTVPVANADHLCRKLREYNSLHRVTDWLIRREYLPIEGTHFEAVDLQASVGETVLNWYGLRMLVDDL